MAFVANPTPQRSASLNMVETPEQQPLTTRDRYKMDINMLDELLDAREENKLEAIRALVKDIQETRSKNPEVALPHKVREALAEFHRAEATFGHDSREARVAHEYFLDVSNVENMQPEHYYYSDEKDEHETQVLDEAVDAVNHLEELKEIAHLEKNILDRFGHTDFEVGEGFLERGIGREDEDTYGMWP